jgi:Zn finger protein HypA/HybF involved in hydrogenase expression
MHEMSIALEVCRIAERHVGALQLPYVVEVGLEVGDDAGVEFEALEFCLEAALATPPFTGAKAAITKLSGDVLRLTYLEVDDGGADD